MCFMRDEIIIFYYLHFKYTIAMHDISILRRIMHRFNIIYAYAKALMILIKYFTNKQNNNAF